LPDPAISYRYGTEFYRYIEAGALRSAESIVPLVLRELAPRSILDVGCGAGAWLSVYRDLGITDIMGIDGDYVRPEQLLIPADRFRGLNITETFSVDARFDLVQCLEVGEHIPESASADLVANLTRHGDRVLFSAATPGQGGENHINEQSFEFWRRLFGEHGYQPLDVFRPQIQKMAEAESWYRRNMILYARESVIASLPPDVAASAVPDGARIPDFSSSAFKARARILLLLPVSWVSRLARFKHSMLLATRNRGFAK
jgi:SAM-dependent methyltransferase